MLPEKTCSIPDCGRKRYARTWCGMHYQRWHNHGSPLGFAPKRPAKECSVAGCESRLYALSLCRTHHARFKKTGDPLETSVIRGDDVARFWSKVEKTGTCWNWTAVPDRDGYGYLQFGGSSQKAHRVSYQLAGGSIPDGMQIDHMCHNRGCVNPEHLRVVTNKQNQENRIGAQSDNKSSGVRGVGWSKLDRKWFARVGHNGASHTVGYFRTIPEAEAAAIEARNRLFTHNLMDRIQK